MHPAFWSAPGPERIAPGNQGQAGLQSSGVEEHMNRRIQELIEQAGMTLKPRELFDDDEPDGYLVSDDDYVRANPQAVRVFLDGGLEKFAELIVQECISRCDGNSEYKNHQDTEFGRGVAVGIEVAKEQIKQHFGVEE
jgi:hypothetical protein